MTRKIVLSTLLTATLLGDIGIMPCAAQRMTLTVDSLFSLIDSRSRTLKLSSLDIAEADAGSSVARSGRLPHISASLSVGYLGNGYLTDRDFSNGMAIHNPHSKNDFSIEAMQLIYSGGAVSGAVRMAGLNARMARLSLEENRQQVRFLMLGQLTDLQCLGSRRRVIAENIGLAHTVIANIKARYDEGVALESDITRYELQLSELELQLEKTDEALRTTGYRLANALGLDAATEFVPRLSFPGDTVPDVGAEPYWHEQAHACNLSLRKAATAIEMSETGRLIAAAEMRPKVSVFAYGRFDSPIVIEVPVLDRNFMYWGVGASLSFNLSSLYTGGRRVHKARIAESESREAYGVSMENVDNGVKAAYEEWQTAKTELRTRESSVRLARQNYDIVSDRLDSGMALVTDMVDAANVRLAAETGLENARIRLLFCYYKLKYATHTL